MNFVVNERINKQLNKTQIHLLQSIYSIMLKELLRNRKKIFLLFVLLFILLFLFRIIYGYTIKNMDENESIYDDFFSSAQLDIRNYATEKGVDRKSNGAADKSQPLLETPLELSAAQKYDKTATAKSNTGAFTEDEEATRGLVKNTSSVIQYEKLFGNVGNRQLHLMIGVVPHLFDSIYKEIIAIGKVSNPEVIKVDKTNEYRQLNARKISLENSLQSLIELKQKGGEIAEYISLNEQILATEQQLQVLGVDLGNFNSVNEFCTIRFSLYEKEMDKPISFMHRVKVALEWALEYYALLIWIIVCMSVAAWAVSKATEVVLRMLDNAKRK